jgi:hypothetical protein
VVFLRENADAVLCSVDAEEVVRQIIQRVVIIKERGKRAVVIADCIRRAADVLVVQVADDFPNPACSQRKAASRRNCSCAVPPSMARFSIWLGV